MTTGRPRLLHRLGLLAAACAIATAGLQAAVQPSVVSAAFPGSNGRIVFVSGKPDKPVIASMASNGSDVQLLTQPAQSPTAMGDQNPQWSPGGKFVAFTRYYGAGAGDIWIMNANGTGQQRLTNNATNDDWPAFSPDGSRIAFTSNRAGNNEIYSMRVDGTDVRRLTNSAADDREPAWSPTNLKIAFVSDRGGPAEIYTMNPDGSGVVRVKSAAGAGLEQPTWPATGPYLTYRTSAGAIWRVNLTTNSDESLVSFGAADPAMAPDDGGNAYRLLYADFSQESEGLNIEIIVKTVPGSVTTLTNAYGPSAYDPDWQPVPAFPLVDAGFSAFEPYIEWVFDEGITSGCTVERYCPDDPVTRGQMAAFLARALGLEGGAPDVFTDDDSSPFEPYINLVAQAGIASGCGGANFCPTGLVTREQMASFIARALDLSGTAADAFNDDEASIHEPNINLVASAGIATGCGSGKYCPTQNVTRGQMAAFLFRAFS